MNKLTVTPKESKTKGAIPLSVFIFCLLGLMAICAVVLVVTVRQAKKQRENLELEARRLELEKQSAELARQKAEDESKLVALRIRQEQALTRLQIATNVLGTLLRGLDAFEEQTSRLLINDAGRAIASRQVLFRTAKEIYEVDKAKLPERDLVRSKLEGFQKLEANLKGAAGTTYEPAQELLMRANADVEWAGAASKKLELAQSAIDRLVKEASGIFVDGKAETLEACLRRGSSADRLFAAMNNSPRTVSTSVPSPITTNETLARIQPTWLNAVKNQESPVDEAEKARLRTRARDPNVLSKLAPLITPGYLQMSGTSYEKAPLSYSGLVAAGALNQTQIGLQQMVNVAFSRQDTVRPRLQFQFNNAKGWQRSSSDRETVVEMQKLLIELGPTLVEMGKLQK